MLDKKTIYLDYQASTPVHPEVLSVMQPYFTDFFGNPHSNDHVKGWESHKAVENSRLKIAQAIGADKDEIIFTSGATEANNMVLKGLEKHMLLTGKDTILVSSIEHKCVLESAAYMNDRGINVEYIQPNSEGIITKKVLKQAMSERVGLVSVMLVNNEIGTIQPIADLAEIAHQSGALFHTDAAQAPVFMSVNAHELNIDFMSFSSHKIYGPKGIGFVYHSRDHQCKLQPLMHGGGQENGLRSGTLPTALCVGLAKAIELCTINHTTNAQHLEQLSNEFWNKIKDKIPEISLNGSHIFRHPGNLNILFPKIKSSHFLQVLQPNIAASTGSACNSGIENPSYVLAEIGLDREQASSSVRFSFGIGQTLDEIDIAVDTIYAVYEEQISAEFAV